MTHLRGDERARYVQTMFTHIAHRYDLMNRVMTAGQDMRWRQEVIDRAGLSNTARLLDLGAGTGDLARLALSRFPGLQVVAADFTLEMMHVGQARGGAVAEEGLNWCAADAVRLPFADSNFDAVISGFLLRNVVDLPAALAEQRRVLRRGGRIVALDTTPPPASPLTPLIRFHLRTVIPTLGGLISGQRDAYTYLPASTESFLEPERLARRMLDAGFRDVGYARKMFGTVAVYWGRR